MRRQAHPSTLKDKMWQAQLRHTRDEGPTHPLLYTTKPITIQSHYHLNSYRRMKHCGPMGGTVYTEITLYITSVQYTHVNDTFLGWAISTHLQDGTCTVTSRQSMVSVTWTLPLHHLHHLNNQISSQLSIDRFHPTPK